jgi:hypothetical protein
MKQYAYSLLSLLQQFSLGQNHTATMQDLVELYCYSLDLSPFEVGHKVAVYLLHKHKAQLQVQQVRQWLGKHSGTWDDLTQEFFAPFRDAECPITLQMIAEKGNFLSVADTLAKLYDERHKADFEITIKKSHVREKVHSYVMYAMWPYFRSMYDASTKQRRRLELPAVGEDGGMSPQILQLIIEICYKYNVRDVTQRVIDADLAMQILSIANLYFVKHENDSMGTFDGLIALSQDLVISGLNEDVCIDVFKQASVLGLADVALHARRVIFDNIKTLLATPARYDELQSLSQQMLMDLLNELR